MTALPPPSPAAPESAALPPPTPTAAEPPVVAPTLAPSVPATPTPIPASDISLPAPSPGPLPDPAEVAPGSNTPVQPIEDPRSLETDVVEPLRSTAGWRLAAIGANLGSVPIAIVVPAVGVALAGLSLVALLVWTGLAVSNVARARAATAHSGPRPAAVAVMSWLFAPVLAVPFGMVLVKLSEWVDDATFDQEANRSMTFFGAVLVVAFVLLIALYRPYGELAAASRWVSGDGNKFRRWFVAPFVASLVAGVVATLVGLALAGNDAESASDSAFFVFGGLTVALASLLPWIVWLYFGFRAMVDLEEAAAYQHRRRCARHEEEGATPAASVAAPMTPEMSAQLRAQHVEPVDPR